MKKNLRIDEVASFLNCSKRGVYRLIEEESLQCFRVRSSLRIPAAELERFVKRQIEKYQTENI